MIGAAAAVITYFVKSSLFENLLSKMFGRLALSDVFTDITSNSIVDVTGNCTVSVTDRSLCISYSTVDSEKTLELGGLDRGKIKK